MDLRKLFSDRDLEKFIADRRESLVMAYNALPDEKALDMEFLKDFKKSFVLDVPSLKSREWTTEERVADSGKNTVLVFVPFNGDPAAFELNPTQSVISSLVAGSPLLIGDVVGRSLVLEVKETSQDIQVTIAIKVQAVKQILSELQGVVEKMDQLFERTIVGRTELRRRKIEHRARVGDSAEFYPLVTASPSPSPINFESVTTEMSSPSGKPRQQTWDIFMSHASPDKAWVRGLVKALRASGVSVWFDEDNLEWGEDLQRGINRGLINSHRAIAVLSKSYLAQRKWTEAEISGLLAREKLGETLILPIWHKVTEDDLKQYNLILASRIAKVSESDNYDEIVRAVLKVLGRSQDIAQTEGGRSAETSNAHDGHAQQEIVAYAWYETNGPDAKTKKLYVHRLVHMKAWFIFNDGQNERQGTMENISDQFAITDRSLRGQGFVRMTFSNPSGLREFEL